MKEPFNILVAGVGGQGNLVCGRIIAEAAMRDGLRPVIGDTFGASRRGGSVLTHVRIGKSDWGPLVPWQAADIILGLEPLETLRACIDYHGDETTVLVSNIAVPPASIGSHMQEYPAFDSILWAIASLASPPRILLLDAQGLANELGSSRIVNAFMIGALTSLESPLTKDSLRHATENTLGHREENLTAFERGVEMAKGLDFLAL